MTRCQAKLLAFIRARIERDGVAPSISEMQVATGISGRGNVHRMLVALDERGFIRRVPYRARAIEFPDQRTITIPPALYDRILKDARQHGVSVSAHVLSLLTSVFEPEPRPVPWRPTHPTT